MITETENFQNNLSSRPGFKRLSANRLPYSIVDNMLIGLSFQKYIKTIRNYEMYVDFRLPSCSFSSVDSFCRGLKLFDLSIQSPFTRTNISLRDNSTPGHWPPCAPTQQVEPSQDQVGPVKYARALPEVQIDQYGRR